MTPRSPRCSIRSRLPGRGKTSAASSTSTSGSTPLHRSSCVCIDHGRRATLLLDELGRARRGVDLPRAPIHGDYKLENVGQLSDGSWLNLDLDFVRIRERLYDVAASLYWASESGADVDLRELCDAYDSSASEPMTLDERRFLPAMITQIPLHWVATAWIMDSVPEAERAMDAAEAWWARREELTW